LYERDHLLGAVGVLVIPTIPPPFFPVALRSIATKDKATDVIKESLLNARKIGQKQLEDFVKDWLVLKDEEQSPKIPLRTPISKNNPLTMASLYKIHTLFPDLRDPFVSAIAIGTGISSCLSISDMLTSLPALKTVTILCNVFLSIDY
jgi:hypothetical protein